MLRRTTPILAALLLFPALLPEANGAPRRRQTASTIQAPASDSGLALLSGPGYAKVISGPRGARKIKIRRNERLVAVEETASGLITAGVRRTADRSQLLFIEADRRAAYRLPHPAGSQPIRVRPTLLVQDGALVGAAWLEGPSLQSMQVKAADWNGSSWEPTTTVSGRSRGSQTGLAGTILADGSMLLVWSQYDGNDDELMFSVRRGDEWSSPRPVSEGNSFPDITPSLVADDSGAALAWSRFDGEEYSVWTAQFRDGGWVSERPAGGKAALYPQLLRQSGATYVVSRIAHPAGWDIASANSTGRVTRRSVISSEIQARPVVRATASGSLTLDWAQHQQRTTLHLEHVR